MWLESFRHSQGYFVNWVLWRFDFICGRCSSSFFLPYIYIFSACQGEGWCERLLACPFSAPASDVAGLVLVLGKLLSRLCDVVAEAAPQICGWNGNPSRLNWDYRQSWMSNNKAKLISSVFPVRSIVLFCFLYVVLQLKMLVSNWKSFIGLDWFNEEPNGFQDSWPPLNNELKDTQGERVGDSEAVNEKDYTNIYI